MISFSDAYNHILDHSQDYGTETVSLKKAVGRVLAVDIYADRDFPPFDRATKDGIAINYNAIENGRKAFDIKATVAAGQKTYKFLEQEHCVEIMTGAVVPYEADTVVMYEDITIEHGVANLNKKVQRGQNIHDKGSDKKVAIGLCEDGGMRGINAGALQNASAVEGMTSVLIAINIIHKVKSAGIRITGI